MMRIRDLVALSVLALALNGAGLPSVHEAHGQTQGSSNDVFYGSVAPESVTPGGIAVSGGATTGRGYEVAGRGGFGRHKGRGIHRGRAGHRSGYGFKAHRVTGGFHRHGGLHSVSSGGLSSVSRGGLQSVSGIHRVPLHARRHVGSTHHLGTKRHGHHVGRGHRRGHPVTRHYRSHSGSRHRLRHGGKLHLHGHVAKPHRLHRPGSVHHRKYGSGLAIGLHFGGHRTQLHGYGHRIHGGHRVRYYTYYPYPYPYPVREDYIPTYADHDYSVYRGDEYSTHDQSTHSTNEDREHSTYEDNEYWSPTDDVDGHGITGFEERLATALEEDRSHSWTDPDTDSKVTVTPTWWYFGRRGKRCRGYEMESFEGETRAISYGKACRDSDGAWEIVE